MKQISIIISAFLLIGLVRMINSCGPDEGGSKIYERELNRKWDQKIFIGKSGQEIQQNNFYETLAHANNILLGEKHYTLNVQQAEADVIKNTVLKINRQFSAGWEFLNIADREKIDEWFKQVENGQLSAEQFLVNTQGNSYSDTYKPIIEAISGLHGQFLPTNLSRDQKKPVVEKGLSAIDANLIPPGFEMGSDDYFDRFKETLTGSGSMPIQYPVENYFAAQCLTDDVITYYFLTEAKFSLRFLVIGSFHVEYGQGTVARFKVRAPADKTLVVRFIDASDYKENELLPLIKSPQYGPLADYVFFVNEPKP